MNKVPLLAIVTPDEYDLVDILLPTLPPDVEFILQREPKQSWSDINRNKARMLRRAMDTYPEFIYTDVDAVFSGKPIVETLRSIKGYDLLFQNDGINGLCMGFVYCPVSTDITRTFLQKVVDDDESYAKQLTCDQEAANKYRNTIKYSLLDNNLFYNCCHPLRGSARKGWRPQYIPNEWLYCHASCVFRPDKNAVMEKVLSLRK